MGEHLTRRQILAAATAGTALAGCKAIPAIAARAGPAPLLSLRAPSPGGALGDTELFLPKASGGAAGFRFPSSPAWELNAPGWYLPDTISAGAGMLDWPERLQYRISTRLKSFREMPALLGEAKSLGTNVVYLVDWYQGIEGTPPTNWWTAKGDYVPRSDLGGEAAFREGLAAVHAQDGRVIVYIEGFIIGKGTNVARNHGAEWSIMLPNGPPEQPYPQAWKMCPAAEGWVAYLESVARRLGGYGVDGIFVDSYGYQKDWMCVSGSHGHAPGKKEVFNAGAAQLLRRVRAAFHSARPDGILAIEGSVLRRLLESADGCLDPGIHSFVTSWLWDAQGRTDTILTGWSVDDWNQIVAIGAKLGCPPEFLDPPPGASATAYYDALMANANSNRRSLTRILDGLHRWRNAGLILGLRMPGLDDLTPRRWYGGAHPPDNRWNDPGILPKLRTRAVAIDAAFGGKQGPAPAAYVKTLLTGRAGLTSIIDYDSTVSRVNTPYPRVAAWKFTSRNGTALTCVSVADERRRVLFPGTTGTWQDGVTGERFTASGGTLTVPVPAHRVRLLRKESA